MKDNIVIVPVGHTDLSHGHTENPSASQSAVAFDRAGRELTSFISDTEAAVFTDAWSPSSVSAFLLGECSVCLTARVSSRQAGYVLASAAFDEGEILRIAVLPEFRGRGVGSELLEKAEKALAERGVKTVFLEVRADNRPAMSLYSSHGYLPTGIRRDYYRDPTCDAVLMKKEL